MSSMLKQVVGCAVTATLATVVACAPAETDRGTQTDPIIIAPAPPGYIPIQLVTGQTTSNASYPRTQSETALAEGRNNPPGFFAPARVVVAAFNDWSGVQYGGSDGNQLPAGASYLGYSISTDEGSTWTYMNSLAPFHADYPILRGDPAAASAPMAPAHVYVGALAHRMAELHWGFWAVDENRMIVPASTLPHGLCVFRATTGVIFSGLACVNAGTDEVDGAALAVGNDETVFISAANVTDSRVEVWRINPTTAVGTLMPRPFPSTSTGGHPQLRFDRASGRLFAAAVAGGALVAAYWNGSAWSAPVTVSPAGVFVNSGNIPFAAPAGTVRQGRFFSFDIADPVIRNGTTFNGYNVRFAFMASVAGGGRGLVVAACASDLTGCARVPAWEPAASSTAVLFDPALRARRTYAASAAPEVRMTWLARASAADPSFYVKSRALAFDAAGATPVPTDTGTNSRSNAQNMCVHATSSGAGYIGDYNEMVAIGSDSALGYRFVRAFTWAPATCTPTTPAGFAPDQHVASIRFF